jgi:hypothetical protein
MVTTFRPKSNFAWAAVAIVLIVLFAINSILVGNSALQTTIELCICCMLLGLTYAVWIRPKLVLGESEITVVNPLRTEVILCRDIRDLETKWSLSIVHSRGTTRVWVAPVTGKRRWIANQTFGWYGRGIPMAEFSERDSQPVSESLASTSGQAAYLIREHLKKLH